MAPPLGYAPTPASTGHPTPGWDSVIHLVDLPSSFAEEFPAHRDTDLKIFHFFVFPKKTRTQERQKEAQIHSLTPKYAFHQV